MDGLFGTSGCLGLLVIIPALLLLEAYNENGENFYRRLGSNKQL